jgi:hypothetical protein
MNRFNVSVIRMPHNLGLSIYCDNVSSLILQYLLIESQKFVGQCLSSNLKYQIKSYCERLLSELEYTGRIRMDKYMRYEFAIFQHGITPKNYYLHFARKR